jgi:hypothetical protein
MINERTRHIWRRRLTPARPFLRCTILRHPSISAREEAMTAFAVAVGSTSLVCYVLMTRLQNRRGNRASLGEGSAGTAAIIFLADWFSSHSALDSSVNPGDRGGGGDGGGD